MDNDTDTPRYNHPAALREWRERWAVAIHQRRTQLLGMSQHQFARFIGASQSTVGTWESAASVPSDLMKIRLIVLLELDAADMFRPLDADPIVQSD